MKFVFEPFQSFQIRAIESIVELFNGLETALPGGTSVPGGASLFGVVPNALELEPQRLLENLQSTQRKNGLTIDPGLRLVGEECSEPPGPVATFPNFSVEMETGTGKTYVYLRTALEISRRYGQSKFLVVVPSVAVCQGVLTSLRVLRDHLGQLYPDIQYRAQLYDSGQIGVVRQFVMSPFAEFLVMTIDSFNKSTNLIYRTADRLHGDSAIALLQATRPILIIDEPQNVATAIATQALARLRPLLALRYSATHRDPYNLVYRLTPADAYKSGLVKQIEVAGLERTVDANRPYVRIVGVSAKRHRVSARVGVHVLRAGGGVREKVCTVESGADLEALTRRAEYAGYIVEEVNPVTSTVRFSNNSQLVVGEVSGADKAITFRSQIRYTVREHLLRQERLRSRGIKVLSLFFVDRVSHYQSDNPIIRDLFDEAFEDLKREFGAWRDRKAADVRAGYFAKKTARDGTVQLLDSNTASPNENDKRAFDLIMKDKERLLAFEEPVAFVFSHSALREGWDNPNICQICTLNQSVSEIRKRQEIGRGLRLVVNQDGVRVTVPEANVLTVVANESYENYVNRYQDEIAEDTGVSQAAPIVRNARERVDVRLRRDVLAGPAFLELWERIRSRTEYRIAIDSEELVTRVTAALDGYGVQPVRVKVSKARMIVREGEFTTQLLSGPRTVDRLDAKGTVERVIETTARQLEESALPCRVTRRTLLDVYLRSATKGAALANPNEWASVATRVIRDEVARQIVNNVTYRETGENYSIESFDDVIQSWRDRAVPSLRGLYDSAVVDSSLERLFVRQVDDDNRTRVYVKLPRWYRVPTPVGDYNPDWAVARFETDEHGEATGKVFFVAETKGVESEAALRTSERLKVSCGRSHFAALGMTFAVVRTLDEVDPKLEFDLEQSGGNG